MSFLSTAVQEVLEHRLGQALPADEMMPEDAADPGADVSTDGPTALADAGR